MTCRLKKMSAHQEFPQVFVVGDNSIVNDNELCRPEQYIMKLETSKAFEVTTTVYRRLLYIIIIYNYYITKTNV